MLSTPFLYEALILNREEQKAQSLRMPSPVTFTYHEDEGEPTVSRAIAATASSIYSYIVSFFWTPDHPELTNSRALLIQHRHQREWHFRQVVCSKKYISLLNRYKESLTEIERISELQELCQTIETYLAKDKTYRVHHKDLTTSELTVMNSNLLSDELYFKSKNITPYDTCLRVLLVNLQNYCNPLVCTEPNDTAEITDAIVDYIFFADTWRMTEELDSQKEFILERYKKILSEKSLTTFTFDLKFHNTGIMNKLKEKVSAQLAYTMAELTVARQQLVEEEAIINELEEKIDALENPADTQDEMEEEDDRRYLPVRTA
jgi:hypothetical protein